MPWVRQPDAGGVEVPEAVKRRRKERILQNAEKCTNFGGHRDIATTSSQSACDGSGHALIKMKLDYHRHP